MPTDTDKYHSFFLLSQFAQNAYIYIYIYMPCFMCICALTCNQYSVYKGMGIRALTINGLVTLLIDYTSLSVLFEIKIYGPNCAIYSVISNVCSSHIMEFVVSQLVHANYKPFFFE